MKKSCIKMVLMVVLVFVGSMGAHAALSISGKIGSELWYTPTEGHNFRSGLGFEANIRGEFDGVTGFVGFRGLNIDSSEGLVPGHSVESRELTLRVSEVWVRFDKPIFANGPVTPYTLGNLHLDYSPTVLHRVGGRRGAMIEDIPLALGSLRLFNDAFIVWDGGATGGKTGPGDFTYGLASSGTFMGNNINFYHVSSLESTYAGEGLNRQYVIDGEGLESTYLFELDRTLQNGVGLEATLAHMRNLRPSGITNISNMATLTANNILLTDRLFANVGLRTVDPDFAPKYRNKDAKDFRGETGVRVDLTTFANGFLIQPSFDVYSKQQTTYFNRAVAVSHQVMAMDLVWEYAFNDEKDEQKLSLDVDSGFNVFGGTINSTFNVTHTTISASQDWSGRLKLETTRDILGARNVKLFGEAIYKKEIPKYGVGLEYELPGGPRLWMTYYSPIDLNDPDHWKERMIKLEYWFSF